MPIKRIPIQERSEKKQTVMLITNHNCNIRCLYCYEPPGLIKSKNLDFEIARDTITKYMESDNGFDNIEFQFFGGECMLSFPLIKRIVDWFHNRDWKKGHVFFICTNGTILTDEMKKWLVKNKQCVVLGFSLDGSRTAHNIGRDNSYDRLKKNIPFFLEHWPTQPAKMTIYAETIPYLADSIIEMEEMGLNFEANTVFEDIWGEG
ncbi:MAG: 4Fe-4S cluster-binding domain-containing protein, partial [bacterium]|nr:4Fe-4S cluster-binding domain-containing protein [bacterium]